MLALPTVSSVDDLPDGRSLVVLTDGARYTDIVIGCAGPRPHPVPGCEWIGARSHRSATRRAPRRRPPIPTRRRPVRVEPFPRELIVPEVVQCRSPASRRRADQLLSSLLTPAQLEDWRASRRFWVDTPRGPVQLGELYSLVHWPIDDPGYERVLCVVPDEHMYLPPADIWSNLLLVLAVEPERFFRVAIERERRRRTIRRDDRAT